MKISFDEYDKICRKLETIPLSIYVPSPQDISRIKSDFDKYYIFAIYVSEYHVPVDDPEQSTNLKALKQIIYENLEISE